MKTVYLSLKSLLHHYPIEQGYEIICDNNDNVLNPKSSYLIENIYPTGYKKNNINVTFVLVSEVVFVND